MRKMERRFRACAGCALAIALCVVIAGCQPQGGSGRNKPSITAVDPQRGAPGRYVTIRGLDFEADHSLNSVFFGSTQATVYGANSAEAVCRVPSGLAAGTHDITLATGGGTSNAVPFQVASAAAVPSISSIEPSSAPTGAPIVIRGSGFRSGAAQNQVTVDGVSATVLAATGTRIDARVPGGAATGPVVVRTGGEASNGVTLMVTSDQVAVPTGPGVHARRYLSASTYRSLVVEIDYVQGKRPDTAALNLLAQRLTERCNKPEGIQYVVSDVIPVPGLSSWTRNDLYLTEMQYRNHYASQDTAVLYLIYVDKFYSGTSTGHGVALGVAYAATGIGMFKDYIDFYGGTTEKQVIVHEAGHNLGLVNNGIPMQTAHEDTQHPHHDVRDSCVMYWSNNGQRSTRFCSDCRDDMRAAGGR
jgi:hypothetical protein